MKTLSTRTLFFGILFSLLSITTIAKAADPEIVASGELFEGNTRMEYVVTRLNFTYSIKATAWYGPGSIAASVGTSFGTYTGIFGQHEPIRTNGETRTLSTQADWWKAQINTGHTTYTVYEGMADVAPDPAGENRIKEGILTHDQTKVAYWIDFIDGKYVMSLRTAYGFGQYRALAFYVDTLGRAPAQTTISLDTAMLLYIRNSVNTIKPVYETPVNYFEIRMSSQSEGEKIERIYID